MWKYTESSHEKKKSFSIRMLIWNSNVNYSVQPYFEAINLNPSQRNQVLSKFSSFTIKTKNKN